MNRDTRRFAMSFGAPVVMHGSDREGSLRRGSHVLLFEAGQPLRFDAAGVEIGARGVLRSMKHLGMLDDSIEVPEAKPSIRVGKCAWIRAPGAGLAEFESGLGSDLQQGQRIGAISDSFGQERSPILSPCSGVVVGLAKNPSVVTGDAIVHVCQRK